MTCKIVTDDYGMSIRINQAIVELVKRGIVSKVSVMANESIAYSVSDFDENIETGLHINLISYPEIIRKNPGKKKTSLLRLFYLIYSGRLSNDKIIDSIDNQSKILECRGFKITYLDTHQHVHIVPKILKSLIIYAKSKGINSIRCITMEKKYLSFYLYSLIHYGFLSQVPKMVFLYSIGRLTKLKLDNAKINYCRNTIIMPIATGGDYSGLLKRFMERFKDKDAELITHPGLDTKATDPDKNPGRHIEYCSLLNLV